MRRDLIRSGLVALLLTATLSLAAMPAAAATCESLAGLSLPDTTITMAVSVPAGPFLPPDSVTPVDAPVAFCRVAGVMRPTSDSEVRFEVWLPATGWNGKFLGAGNGGYGGSFGTPRGFMLNGLARGYAVAGTDMGHLASVTPGGSFALGHPEKIADWAYRATHLTAVNGKAVTAAFYGTGPRLSYFNGCSDGGHEGLMEAQRFPDDYDGIIAGAPANYWTHQSAAWVWARRATTNPANFIPPAKLSLITQAAVTACDGLDGLDDGMIEDPRRCDFDPATLVCQAGDAPDCLTAAQAEAVRQIYAGPVNPRTGEQIYPGLEPGSESSGWTILTTPAVPFLGADFYRYFVFDDPSWDYRTLDYDQDIAYADAKMGPIVDSNDADLTPFRARGGKLIIWHGWNDPLVNPRNSINYYERVDALMKARHLKDTDSFLRLFMAPGMNHCAGGTGLNTFDAMSALERWIEQGIGPDELVASNAGLSFPNNVFTTGAGSVTRPLCAYPRVPNYTLEGSTTDAANFVCELKGLDRADQASGFDEGLEGRNNARRKQAR